MDFVTNITTYSPMTYTGNVTFTNETVYSFSENVKLVFLGIKIFFMVLILVGNISVVVAYTLDKHLRTPANYYVMSVIVTDIMAGLLAVPTAILYTMTSADTDSMCKAFTYMMSLCEAADVYSMVLIAGDRYMRVVMALNSKRTKQEVLLQILIVWIVCILYSGKELFVYESMPYAYWKGQNVVYFAQCQIKFGVHSTLAQAFAILDLLLLFSLPLSVIWFFYGTVSIKLRSHTHGGLGILQKKKAVQHHVMVVVFFFFTAGGLHILRFYVTFGPGSFSNELVVRELLTTLAFADFWINPLIYAYMNSNFRIACIQLLQNGMKPRPHSRASVAPLDEMS